jgi:predicted amidohydrolase
MAILAATATLFGRDLETCFAQIEALIATAEADLLVLPECALGGYLHEDGGLSDLPPTLDPDGPEIARLAEIAGDTIVCAGFTETGMYSSAVCVHRGRVLGHQRKVHLPPTERFAFTAGDGFAAFDTPLGRVGMLICYDKLFPEAARALALDGAEIIATMSAWPDDRADPASDRQARHFDVIDQARAIENQVTWVAANLVGRWGSLNFFGGAKVVDADGVIVAACDDGIARGAVDPRSVGAMRAHIDHLGDRRPETYGTGAALQATG